MRNKLMNIILTCHRNRIGEPRKQTFIAYFIRIIKENYTEVD